MQTPEEQLAELKREEEKGEVDVNMQEYKKRRDEARRSPYPSVIVEVQSTPPPDFGTRRDEAAMMEAAAADMMGAKMSDNSDGDVTSEDVKKLEALFGLSAAKKSTKPDDPFYDALGEVRRLCMGRFYCLCHSKLISLHLPFDTLLKTLGIWKQASYFPNATTTGSELGTTE